MGNALSASDAGETGRDVTRAQAVTELKRRHGQPLPVGSTKAATADWPFIQVSCRLTLLPPSPPP